MLGAAFSRYSKFCASFPLASAFTTCWIKGAASDVTAQTVVEQRSFPREVNFSRTVVFATFSGAYLGWGQHVVYNVWFARMFGEFKDMSTRAARIAVVKKVCTDSIVHVPLMYLPLYFTFESWALAGVSRPQGADDEGSQSSLVESFASWLGNFRWADAQAGFSRYVGSEGWDAVTAYWKMWPLFHWCNFTFTPPHLRIGVIAGFSYLWLIVLSFLSHREIDAHSARESFLAGGDVETRQGLTAPVATQNALS
eukprot:TRINITY_DN12335_c0_g1_i1.p1 TRINITY_DN12335_c0_g1~~TRINITY_DN12335_c0_g1_i1.p1  ORF type:complete len:253 (+),score=35.73 TRINITY_DN12335_c0_g1_i1:54-812(+)